MSEYAKQTTVSPEKSRAEIETILRRYGADQFASGWSGNHAMIGFTVRGKAVRFVLNLPQPNDKEFMLTATRKMRSPLQRQEAYEQAVRQKWRALCLTIKAKLEAVQAKISVFEEEFLPYFVLPGGLTVAEAMLPQLEAAYKTGEVPRLMPMLPPPAKE